jgi:hypothetical protein
MNFTTVALVHVAVISRERRRRRIVAQPGVHSCLFEKLSEDVG